MVTQQTPPGPDEIELQRKRQMRRTTNRKLGAFAATAAIATLAVVAFRVSWEDGGQRPATSGATAPSVAPPATTAPSVAPPGRVTTAPWFAPSATHGVDYVLDLDTGMMTPLPETIIRSLGVSRPRSDGRYAASPDGSTLAYVAPAADGRYQIFVANLDGSAIRQVTHDPVAAISPAWSPDGTRIAHKRHGTGDVPGLFVLEVATAETTQVIDGIGWGPQFTPDGSSLLYGDGSNQQPELWTVPIAGGPSSLLLGSSAGPFSDAGNGSMSPDGSLVTFLSGGVCHCGPWRFVANADGTQARAIPGWMANPAGTWSPDGTRIVSQDGGGGSGSPSYIVVVDAATGQGTKVARGRAATWLDDHTLLVEA